MEATQEKLVATRRLSSDEAIGMYGSDDIHELNRMFQGVAGVQSVRVERVSDAAYILNNDGKEIQICVDLPEPCPDEPPDVNNESPLCGCGEPTCMGTCGTPPWGTEV